jgi:hypothetical protein
MALLHFSAAADGTRMTQSHPILARLVACVAWGIWSLVRVLNEHEELEY